MKVLMFGSNHRIIDKIAVKVDELVDIFGYN
jgi:hypothetical protein